MSRDKLAGWQHGIELLIAIVGFAGWAYWVTHKQPNYMECDCKLAEVKRRL